MPAIGFGTTPFSTGQFGIADWAEEELFKTIPLIYRELDVSEQDKLLRKTINGYKPPFNELRRFIDKIPKQRDPRECDFDMLNFLANDFFVRPDAFKFEIFQRSAVIHVAQQVLLKGTDKGYVVIGSYDGYIVAVAGLWETSCGTDVLVEEGPTFVPAFDQIPIDFFGFEVNEQLATGTATGTTFTGTTRRKSILPGTVTITTQMGGQVVTDDGAGNLVGSIDPGGVNTIDYVTGAYSVQFLVDTLLGERILTEYTWTIPTNVDYVDEFQLWDRRETFFPLAGTTTLTLVNENIRFVHVLKNGVPLIQDGPVDADFSFDGVDTITLHDPSVVDDVYEVQIIDGFQLNNGIDPDPRCRSHSLCVTITLGPLFTGSLTPLNIFVDRLRRKVKPIHVDFACLVYIIEFPTITTPTLVTMTGEVTVDFLIEEEEIFDISPADVEPVDGGLMVDME